jgi:hypothetical protein
MDEIEDLIAQLREKGEQVSTVGPQSEKTIADLEHALGVTLPPSYRQFLAHFGGFKLLGSSVSGILDGQPLAKGTGSLYGDTQLFRRELGGPEHLLVIQPDQEAPYCLDTRKPDRNGEMPVVCYELDTKHVDRMAASFGEWFAEYLELQLDDDA